MSSPLCSHQQILTKTHFSPLIHVQFSHFNALTSTPQPHKFISAVDFTVAVCFPFKMFTFQIQTISMSPFSFSSQLGSTITTFSFCSHTGMPPQCLTLTSHSILLGSTTANSVLDNHCHSWAFLFFVFFSFLSLSWAPPQLFSVPFSATCRS